MRCVPFGLLTLSLTTAACGAVSPATPDGAGPGDSGHVTFGDGAAVFRVAARPGATPDDVSALVGAGGGAPERRLNLSPGGTTYVFETGDLGRLSADGTEGDAFQLWSYGFLALVDPRNGRPVAAGLE